MGSEMCIRDSLKAAQLLPMAITVQTNQELNNLTRLPDEIILKTEFEHIVSAPLPLQLAQAGRLHVYRPHDGGDEHYAIEIGVLDRTSSVLTRLHSACFTGGVIVALNSMALLSKWRGKVLEFYYI